MINALRALLGERFAIETATSGEEALARLRARRFHVLVSEQRMPGMAGVELLRRARALGGRLAAALRS
ncbi:MAG: response regulator [Burkholderiales bacterium]|nr:response regulator [Burkholderiales bacterium]